MSLAGSGRGRVLIHRRAWTGRGDEPIPPQVIAAIMRLPARFGQLAISEGPALDVKKLERPTGAYRLKVHPWRVLCRPVGADVIVFLIDHRQSFYERAARMDLARAGDAFRPLPGVLFATERREIPSAPRRVPPQAKPARNPWSAFSDQQLHSIRGVSPELVAWMRSVPPGIDVHDFIGEQMEDTDLAVLLIDLWERPGYYADLFASGEVPDVERAHITEPELAAAVGSGAAGDDLYAPGSEQELARAFSSGIEEWMVYLPRTQRSIVDGRYNGPSRLRGTPGTGKTVVALHRAISLARETTPGEQVLLTSYVKATTQAWPHLLRLIDNEAASRVVVRHVDRLVADLCPVSDAGPVLDDDKRRMIISVILAGRSALRRRLDVDALMREFDNVLSAGMVSSAVAYRQTQRRGTSAPLGRHLRDEVWLAYEEYRERLADRGETDFHLRRLEALDRARSTGRRRFSGVIIDEAQDLTPAAISLLLELDGSPRHSRFMLIGDERQALYEGAASLLRLGIDVRGRARVLRRSWRCTKATLVAADEVIADMEEPDDDASDEVIEQALARRGTPPDLHVCPTRMRELEVIQAIVEEALEDGGGGALAVLAPTNRQVDEVVAALQAGSIASRRLSDYDGRDGVGALVGTFHVAKSFSFGRVVVSGLCDETWPFRAWRERRSNPAITEAVEGHRRALYVAMTRARDNLALTATTPVAESVLRAQPSTMTRVEW